MLYAVKTINWKAFFLLWLGSRCSDSREQLGVCGIAFEIEHGEQLPSHIDLFIAA